MNVKAAVSVIFSVSYFNVTIIQGNMANFYGVIYMSTTTSLITSTLRLQCKQDASLGITQQQDPETVVIPGKSSHSDPKCWWSGWNLKAKMLL